MLTIKEAAKDFAENYATGLAPYMTLSHNSLNESFKAGVEFAQRWIPVDEELPPVGELVQIQIEEPFSGGIFYDHDKTMEVENGIKIFECEQCAVKVISWRPINMK